jgi:hypothetical protein
MPAPKASGSQFWCVRQISFGTILILIAAIRSFRNRRSRGLSVRPHFEVLGGTLFNFCFGFRLESTPESRRGFRLRKPFRDSCASRLRAAYGVSRNAPRLRIDGDADLAWSEPDRQAHSSSGNSVSLDGTSRRLERFAFDVAPGFSRAESRRGNLVRSAKASRYIEQAIALAAASRARIRIG